MNDSKDKTQKNKRKSSLVEYPEEEEEFGDGVEEIDGLGETSASWNTSNEMADSESTLRTQEKQSKTLRFAVSEEIDVDVATTHHESKLRGEQEGEGIDGIRSTPLLIPQCHRASDVVRFLENDTRKGEPYSSVYWDTENPVFQAANFSPKSLSNAMIRFPMKSQADYHLLLSARFRCLEGVIEALKQGANVNFTQDSQCPIIIATENNDKRMVQYLVTVNNINLNVRNKYGFCPLLIALKNRYDEIAALLLKNNARLDIADSFGRTPLHEAVLQENYDLVELLIRHGTDLETMDHFGEKPIYSCSVKKPNLIILELLLQSGASCEYENITGLSLLSRAILHTTNFYVIKKLVMAGANINHQDYYCKRTPLHMAAIIDSVKIAKFLLENGADPELKTIAGYTAFDLALCYRCYDVAQYLATHTKSTALNAENFITSFLNRVSKHGSGLNLVMISNKLSQKKRRHAYTD